MEKATDMEMEREEVEEEETESVSDVLRDRFRLSTISIAEAEAKRNGMEISEPIVACISDLAFKYAAEQLAKDLELFAQHASRKIVKMEDVILSGPTLLLGPHAARGRMHVSAASC
ncbi:protein MHF1 homolog isoform X3 [Quercus lobata]|uniref:protein MHF1 homolog isoform X3 n=1 Tax=Quercus lobata TaxID=97700 RepID=UPI0012491760|nr:protein MHF1 homolog isoform X3 [Quercus lobata]